MQRSLKKHKLFFSLTLLIRIPSERLRFIAWKRRMCFIAKLAAHTWTSLSRCCLVSYWGILRRVKGLQDLSKNGNCDGIQIIICYKCNVKWLRIVQATCWLRNRMDLIKFGNFIFFRNFSSKKNIWVFSKFLVIFYWKKLSCLEMHFAPSWAVWAIKLFFKKYFLEKVFLWKVKWFALNCATKSCTPLIGNFVKEQQNQKHQ